MKMLRREEVLQEIQKELEMKEGRRKEVIFYSLQAGAKEKKQFLSLLRPIIEDSIIYSKKPVIQTYSEWRQIQTVLEKILSPINIKEGKRIKKHFLPLQKTIRRSFMHLVLQKEEEVLLFLRKEIQLAIEHPGSSLLLKIPIKLLHIAKKNDVVEKEIVIAYKENIKNMLIGKKEAPGWIRDILMAPGLFIFFPGCRKHLRSAIHASISAMVIEDSIISRKDILLLLQAEETEELSLLLLSGFHKTHRQAISKELYLAVEKYLLDNPLEKAISLLERPWHRKSKKKVQKSIEEVFSFFSREKPKAFTDLFISNLKGFFDKSIPPREKITVLKYLSKALSDNIYFEESFVTLLVDSLLKGFSLKKLKRIVGIFNTHWKFTLKTRTEEILRDFQMAEKIEEDIFLIHANSFRWPSDLCKIDIKDIPIFSKIKKRVSTRKKRERIQIEWMDGLSTVELQVEDVSVTVSLLQYHLIMQIEKTEYFNISEMRKTCSSLDTHLSPLVEAKIIEKSNSSEIAKGSLFSSPRAWKNLYPSLIMKKSEENVSQERRLESVFLDSFIIKQLKETKTIREQNLISTLTSKYSISEQTISSRIHLLIAKGFISASHGILEYLP
ncbi:hypothetical protein NEFER03_0528 [Nematocida sp. LUAm3]|nr:hypothetical protein NEFER03_0528 [Nematocida sp. LUAm3]KAI5175495.1 hypothetical protein NEFER02_1401 [Nematocida sp. LUAm2]KAI5178475.1 hypothetical protein NEFER01_1622 [Nematocida sp. LUAm1]